MAAIKRNGWLILPLLLLVLLTACGGERAGNLVFCNESDCPVGRVALSGARHSEAVQNADDSAMGRGDSVSFAEDPDEPGERLLQVYGADGETLLAELRLSCSFESGRRYQVTLTQAGSGRPRLSVRELPQGDGRL